MAKINHEHFFIAFVSPLFCLGFLFNNDLIKTEKQQVSQIPEESIKIIWVSSTLLSFFLICKQKATHKTIWENEKLCSQPFVVALPLQQ